METHWTYFFVNTFRINQPDLYLFYTNPLDVNHGKIAWMKLFPKLKHQCGVQTKMNKCIWIILLVKYKKAIVEITQNGFNENTQTIDYHLWAHSRTSLEL